MQQQDFGPKEVVVAAGGGTAETGFCMLLEASAVLNMVLINKHCTCHLVI
jgi:hypothetical protein